ncbi:DUF5753 domain-containing protein [Actinomadura sp. NBRC 104412]|uniref:DUF5753 domain-containing protein n=1 Tax=Actinomadura sp. NBRC 104412 TaxID=3032203 RepID=UPI0033314E9B
MNCPTSQRRAWKHAASGRRRVFRPDGPTYEVIIDEFALRRLVTPPDVMAVQLQHMIELVTDQPRLTVRVLPLDSRPSPSRLHTSFVIYTFPDPADPPLVLAEGINADLIHTKPSEVAGYERTYDRLSSVALPSLESLSLLERTAGRLTGQMESET